MEGVGGGAEGLLLGFYLDHGDEIGAIVVVVLEFTHELVLGVGFQDELVDGLDDVLMREFVVEVFHLAEVVQLHPPFGLEAGVAAVTGRL
jgi:hypothetical protein